jgi:hypothetical protein
MIRHNEHTNGGKSMSSSPISSIQFPICEIEIGTPKNRLDVTCFPKLCCTSFDGGSMDLIE